MASLYSMKPKPFMSLISVMSPVPWDAKWASTSALVARDEVRGLNGGGRARRGSRQVEAQRARRAGWGAYHCAAGCPGTGGWMTLRSCLLRSVFQAIRSCNGRDWTGLSLSWIEAKCEATGGEWHGGWQPYRGRSLGGGLVWDADGLRLAVGKSVEEGPVAGAELLGSKVGWLAGRLGGWVWVWGWAQRVGAGEGCARQASKLSRAASSRASPFSPGGSWRLTG